MARVAVCVPCWNQLVYTKRMVESVERNSAGHEVTFILLDNGSTDGTRDYLNRVVSERQRPRDRVIELDANEGVNPAWNHLLGAVFAVDDGSNMFDVICLANNDIVVGPGWLDAPAKALARDANSAYFLANGGPFAERTFEVEAEEMRQRFANQRAPGKAGWCFFFTYRHVWRFWPIPHELVLWYGDDWIHYKLANAGFCCETLLDCCVLHFGSKSVAEYPDKVATIQRDREAFRRLTGLDVR